VITVGINNPVADSNAADDSVRTWIFQANPAKYRIEDSLLFEGEELWNLNQHARDVHTGDRAIIWMSGAGAGIYAIGTVISEPVVQSDSPTGLSYWRVKSAGYRQVPRVHVRYGRRFLEHPLRKEFILRDEVLARMTIFRAPQGTVFTVTDTQWEALRVWLDE
jgi:hypothetical protein